MPDALFSLMGRPVGLGTEPVVVAEIGVNHNGDLDLARRTIDAAAEAGADAVKFQSFHAGEFMSDRKLLYEYESGGKPESESMYEMFKRLELPENWHRELQAYAHNKGLEFLSSAADRSSLDLLRSMGVPALKASSEDLINTPLLRDMGASGLPLMLSTGMGDEGEISHAISTVRDAGGSKLMLLHCVSLYPTPDEEANLQRIMALRERYDVPVGYSDHTLGIEAASAAVALGAVLIEKHFTLDRSLPGPDHAMSSDPEELGRMVALVRKTWSQMGTGMLGPSQGEEKARLAFRRSIVAATDIPEGTEISAKMLGLKRPGTGLHPRNLKGLTGKRPKKDIATDEQIRWEDLQ